LWNVNDFLSVARSAVADEEAVDLASLDLEPASPSITEEDGYECLLWNVNGIRARIKKSEFLASLRRDAPDVLVLTEFRCSWDFFIKLPGVRETLVELGLVHYVLHGSTDNVGQAGVLLLSRIKPVSTGVGVGDASLDAQGRVVFAEFPDSYVVGVYVPTSGRPGELKNMGKRLAFDAAFLNFLSQLPHPAKPRLVVGDFNVAARGEDASRRFWTGDYPSTTNEERESFRRLVDESGFVDLYEAEGRRGPTNTWHRTEWDRRRDVGMRLVRPRLSFLVGERPRQGLFAG
jgi:exodeoxyribonuclease-3